MRHDADGQECMSMSPKPNFSSLIFVVVLCPSQTSLEHGKTGRHEQNNSPEKRIKEMVVKVFISGNSGNIKAI